MRKPWSISTTVRNPERLRGFLRVLKKLEGENFTKEIQVKYQIMLIQERLYVPRNIPFKYKEYFDDPSKEMPYSIAEEIFYLQDYKDPPMRGRQSVNPLNKLGFCIAREGLGAVKITELGNIFLQEDYDISYVFFKSLLKLQYPNPWSEDEFSSEEGFDIVPFIATLKLMFKLNQKSKVKGLSREEFYFFVPTLINANQIEEQIERILTYRSIKNSQEKQNFITEFLKDFYGRDKLSDVSIKNLRDYGDNAMRYFRLTKYFCVEMDNLGFNWRIDLERDRMTEVEQLLDSFTGEAISFDSLEEYIAYISDITKPVLPWERLNNLRRIAISLRDSVLETVEAIETEKLTKEEKDLLTCDIGRLTTKKQIEEYIKRMREIKIKLKMLIRKKKLINNIDNIREIIRILESPRVLRRLTPENFEKLLTDALKTLNDELLIQPNYPMDDEGEPIAHAPGNKADIECFYKRFKAICEATLNTTNTQWMQECQPIMRHLRDFEKKHGYENVYCIFVAPTIHQDTYNTFWYAVKYEYQGKAQKIIPLTSSQFALLLRKLITYIEKGQKFTHHELLKLYEKIINEVNYLNSSREWANRIDRILKQWAGESA